MRTLSCASEAVAKHIAMHPNSASLNPQCRKDPQWGWVVDYEMSYDHATSKAEIWFQAYCEGFQKGWELRGE